MRRIISSASARQKVDEAGGNLREAARRLGIPKSTLWDALQKDVGVKRFVVTYAQNDTPVHQGFYDSVMTYCKENKAELICYKGYHWNKTSPHTCDKNNPIWAKDLWPYLLDSKRELNENLVIYPAKTVPTAANPLQGYESVTGHKSGIFPHPKLDDIPVSTPGHMMAKILTTTGAITVKNYSDTKTGNKGDFHHIIGAAIVEVKDNKVFHLRHINADQDGSFYDIAGGKIRLYDGDKVTTTNTIDTMVFGDLHFPFVHWPSFYGAMDLLEKIKCNRLVIHDVIDFYRENHHTKNDRFLNAAKEQFGDKSVEEEIRGAANLIMKMSHPERELLITRSNHDEALDRWLNESNPNDLGINSAYYHYLCWRKHKSVKQESYGYSFANPLEIAVGDMINLKEHNIRFLKRSAPEIHLDIDYSMHGDKGPNGSRGSLNNLSKIGTKSTTAHNHGRGIKGGHYRVGTKSIIPLGYAIGGPGSWTHTDQITYSNGKRTLINWINGECHL